MSDDSADRVHPPTPGRRLEAWRRGSAARSEELNLAVAAIACGVLLRWTVPHLLDRGTRLLHACWETPWDRLPNASPGSPLPPVALLAAAELLLPLLALAWLATTAAEWAQAGWFWNWDRLAPKLERLNPARNLSRTVSAANWAASVAGILKAVVFLAGAAWLLSDDAAHAASLAHRTIPQLALGCGEIASGGLIELGVLLLLIGVLDYSVRRLIWERRLYMTDQELRDDLQSQQAKYRPAPRPGVPPAAATERIAPLPRGTS